MGDDMEHFDLIVIGAGVGGSVVDGVVSSGQKCAIIEDLKFGGTCLTKGCIPSKKLTYPADMIMDAKHAKKIGLEFELKSFDWDVIAGHMWSAINESADIEAAYEANPKVTVFKGTAEFVGKRTIRVSGKEITSDKIVIAVGARTNIPKVKGLEEAGYVCPESFFADKFPEKPYESFVIIGGGAIGCEFAHIFNAFGAKVTVVEAASRILSTEEPEISKHVEKAFRRVGIEVFTGCLTTEVRLENGQKAVYIENRDSSEITRVEGLEVFVATGLKSNGDKLKIENTDVEVDDRGWVVTNEFLETNVPGIWALGDINGKFQLRHKADKEAEILVRNVLAQPGEKEAVDYSRTPWAIYTYPQVGHLGMTEEQVSKFVAEKGEGYYVGKMFYSSVAKGTAMGYDAGTDDDGFVKVICDERKKLLGAHIVGADADLLIQGLTYTVSLDDLFKNMVIHPSLSEVANWVFYDLERRN